MADSGSGIWRRVQDKALLGLLGAVLGLIGIVYGIHRAEIQNVDQKADGIRVKVDENHKAVTTKTAEQSERIRALEENKIEIQRRLDSIDIKQDRLDGKIDRVGDKIDTVIREIKR